MSAVMKTDSTLISDATDGIILLVSIDKVDRSLPKEAIKNGSDFLVIGRPITASSDVKNSLQEIYDSIK